MMQAESARPRPTLAAHLQIARFDHWVKNVFVLPGVVVALGLDPRPVGGPLLARLALGLLATGFVASSNYVLNELLDGRFDALHPTKRDRPVPSGRVSIPLAYAQWLLMMVIGLALASRIGLSFTLTMAWLWVMGCIYNIPPVRSKDLPYVDVLSEAINNPIRMLAGWFIVAPNAVAPASLLLSYWMVGCYFMAIKRFSEYRMIGSAERASSYRKSFAYYDERKLLVSITFYASAAMLFLGAFIMRYRLELIFSFPFVALVMAVYLSVSFKPDSAAQAPEKLYREPNLMASVVVCAVVMTVLCFVSIPSLPRIFAPTAPTKDETKSVEAHVAPRG
jgi:decaprenyl-phosphate phosphoribosyltransferase